MQRIVARTFLRTLRLAALLCALLLPTGQARAQPPREDWLPASARLDITLVPARNQAEIDISAFSPRNSPNGEALDPSRLQEAFEQALGGPVQNAAFDTDTNQNPASQTVGWHFHAECGDISSPLSRQGLLQTGRFDAAPVIAFLSSLGNRDLNLEVALFTQGAPTALCTGPDIADITFGRNTAHPSAVKRFSAHISIPSGTTADSPVPEVFSFATGYTPVDIARLLLPPATLLVLALPLMLAFRWRALHAMSAIRSGNWTVVEREEALSAIRFGYLRLLNNGLLGFMLVWLAVFLYSNPASVLLWTQNIQSHEATSAIPFLACAVPVVSLNLLAVLLSRPILFQSDAEPVTVSDILLSTGIVLALQIIPAVFLFIALGALQDALPEIAFLNELARSHPAGVVSCLFQESPHLWRCLAWLSLAYLSRQALVGLNAMAHPAQKVGSGALYDRVMALAEEAGVSVKNLIYATTGSLRTVNAAATSSGSVILTDRLLEVLSRREVDAVVAHEIAHLKYRHPQKLVAFQILPFLPMAGLFVLSLVRRDLGPFLDRIVVVVLPGGVLICLMFQMWLSRRWERMADRESARLSGDPIALLTGLARLRQAVGMPQDWGKRDPRLFTHPSNLQRVENLSEAGYLTPEEAKALIEADAARLHSEKSPEEVDRYPAPGGPAERRIFSLPVRARHAVKNQWRVRAIFALAPLPFLYLATAHPAPALGPNTIEARLLLMAAAGLLVFALAMWNQISSGTSLYRSRLPQLRARFLREGILTAAEIDAPGTRPVCLSPGPFAHIYGTTPDWDCGYLLIDTDHLSFVGELARFTIARSCIRAIRLTPNWPGLISAPRILLSWTAVPESLGGASDENSPEPKTYTATIRPATSVNLLQLRSDIDRLLVRLQAWEKEGETVTTGPAFTPSFASTPKFENANGIPLSQLLQAIRKPKAHSGLLLSVLAAGIFANLPIGLVFCMVALTATLLFVEVRDIARHARRESDL